ncbi:hypothetical protein HUJ05_012691 [Dendroctonus ponderosae]|nr:hypothetical protein HUJ05_012691 [Dendroctonus ponderosae]
MTELLRANFADKDKGETVFQKILKKYSSYCFVVLVKAKSKLGSLWTPESGLPSSREKLDRGNFPQERMFQVQADS